MQRDVEPVLGLLRVGDHEPATADELRIVLTHFELGERLVAVDADCATLDLPTPQNPDELTALSQVLTDIGAAARSVAALRHDVLFLHPGSPVSVPDVASAEQFAAAVLDYDENGSPREAAERLDALADDPGRPRAGAGHRPRALARRRRAAGPRPRWLRRGGRRARRCPPGPARRAAHRRAARRARVRVARPRVDARR